MHVKCESLHRREAAATSYYKRETVRKKFSNCAVLRVIAILPHRTVVREK